MISLTDLTQKQWLKACKKLGLNVDVKSGKGSHARVKHPSNSLRPLTIPHNTHKMIGLAVYKTLLEWGFSEEEIDKALKK